jgi:hypothetical protein
VGLPTSSVVGLPKVATDRHDLAFSETRLYMTTNLTGNGRIVMTLDLGDLLGGQPVHWAYTNPLDGMYQFSDLSQQNLTDVHCLAIADSSTLQVMRLMTAPGRTPSVVHGTDLWVAWDATASGAGVAAPL